MKRNTIKWRIFKYNIIAILLLIILASVIFNIAVRIYIENDILEQLQKIAARTEDTALRKGPDFFLEPRRNIPSLLPDNDGIDILKYYFMLDRSLREPLSVLNADYMLLDKKKNMISVTHEGMPIPSPELIVQITNEIAKTEHINQESYMNFQLSGTEYIAIIKPVFDKNSFGLGWIVIYSSLQKVNQLQIGINIILLVILIISALIIVLLSSILSKKISEPFSSLNQHIRAIAERNFDAKLQVPVDDELQELVNNINSMSEKLESYDKAQKTFLQNASHEFRTPIMSIQSYAEGIKYDVVEKDTAVNIIVDESKRLTRLVEDLLYLSRLDSIEENYHFSNLDFHDFMNNCIERMNGIALKSNVMLTINDVNQPFTILADEEKLSRAISNIISNCLRYAAAEVNVSVQLLEEGYVRLTITDDGPGFDANELLNIFERFYKGKKGNFGLGLAITKNIIERHHGKISAINAETGAQFIIQLPTD
ncbi:MAG: integral rane sensor signal transduction histidine kinase [Clostridia bacterium]|jgi:signal transduction histidine kinase|nr:integral rane sensor signal transduction histidine kinase [Clostridia bacterium]